ncbi:hypothetical protein [Ruminococcus sp.]|uniref:hypothetical protein n=1 Tax=Ruminococcus sp. TaxID=41978 RepID=UPI0025EE4CA0|nr:hypothetical protein [Ruminococcus sp.]MBQ8966321.1 hypothetical protein [Ruminococcus sp.]
MKKLLALTLALTMTAAMLGGCGDTASEDSKKEDTTTTTTTAAETEAPEESEAPEETEAPAETEAPEETEAPAEEEPASGAAGLDAIKDRLLNYDNASLKFALDTDVSQFIYPFNQENTNNLKYKDADGNDIENPHKDEVHTPGEEGYGGNEAVLDISVQDVGGIPMCKFREIYTQWKDADGNVVYERPDDTASPVYMLRKWNIDLDKLFAGHEDELAKIFTVKFDVVAIAQEPASDNGEIWGTGIYWLGGEMGTNNVEKWSGNLTGFDMSSDKNDEEGWINQWAYTEIVGRPGVNAGTEKSFGFEGNDHNYIFFQTWASTHHQLVDFYIADMVLLDESDNVIPVPEENIPGGASYDVVDPLGDGTIYSGVTAAAE